MNMLSRIGAACGAVFAIVLTVAAGDGSQSFSGPRAVAGVAALTVAVPFIAYLCSVLRAAAREGDGWLAHAALAAGIIGIVLKLGSGAPELALHQAHLVPGTPALQRDRSDRRRRHRAHTPWPGRGVRR